MDLGYEGRVGGGLESCRVRGALVIGDAMGEAMVVKGGQLW